MSALENLDLAADLVCEADCRHGVMRYFATDDTIGRSLALYGEWAEAESMLFAQIVRKGDHVFDIGANIGTHTVPLAHLVGPTGKVEAFEPSPFNVSLLQANLAANGAKAVVTHPVCVGASPGVVAFPLVSPRGATNLGAIGFYIRELWTECQTFDCPMVSIDSLAPPRLDFVKIDVEGHELEVLDGAIATIAAKRPAIFVEVNNAVAFKSNPNDGFAPAVIERLRGLGYSFWHYPTMLFNAHNWRGNPDNIFNQTKSYDMLCVPQERFVVVGLVDAERHARRNSNPEQWRTAAVVRID